MNLTTHWIFAVALGVAVFHQVEIALVMAIGSLIPDLDREYLFVAKRFIERHQLHRSLFHNFFVIGALYLFNPFLSLGALSHTLLDTFTSATDRGAEVIFPFTRLVSGYYYKIDGAKSSSVKKAGWWVEDPWRLLKETSDRDLQEPTEQPWRRSYGPFKNSRIVDWAIFFSSLSFLAISYGFYGSSLYLMSGFRPLSLVSLLGIGIFYALGEVWRRRLVNKESSKKDWIVLGVLILGLATFFAGCYYLYSPPILVNLRLVSTVLISVLVGFFLAYVFVRARRDEDMSL